MSQGIENVDILVIGAGPSGCVAASIANQQGFKVKIVERSKFPRFVIGESLLPKCMEHLEEAGFMEALKAQNYQKKYGAKFIRGDKDCLFNFSEQYTEGWTWTWQVPRDHFDNVLATEVQKMGVDVSFQSTVTGVEFEGSNSTTTVLNADGSEQKIKAKYVIDSSGYGRVLPRLLDLEKKDESPVRKAIFTHLTDTLRPTGADGQQITFVIHKKDVWMWIIPFSNGNTSIGFVGNSDYIDSFDGETKDEKIFKMIQDVPQMKDRFMNQTTQVNAHQIETYGVSSKQLHGDGFVITGNSSEFIDPIFSSGVTFATQSGLLAGKIVGKELRGETVDWNEEYVDHILHGIDTFRTYVKSWYDGSLQDIFFFTSDHDGAPSNVKMKRQICSVLAGYVWDKTNPFVRKHAKAVSSLSRVVQMSSEN